jgi:hypothetical protein
VRQRGSTGQPDDGGEVSRAGSARPMGPCPSGPVFWPIGQREAPCVCMRGRRQEGLEGCRRPLRSRASATPLVGRVALPGAPPPMTPAVTRSLLLPLFSVPGRQSSCGAPGKDRRSAARSARTGRNDRRGRPPVRRTLAPPFGLVPGPSFQFCAAAGRPRSGCTAGALGVPASSGTPSGTPTGAPRPPEGLLLLGLVVRSEAEDEMCSRSFRVRLHNRAS